MNRGSVLERPPPPPAEPERELEPWQVNVLERLAPALKRWVRIRRRREEQRERE